MSNPTSFRGERNGLVLYIDSAADPEEIIRDLRQKADAAAGFLKQAGTVTVKCGLFMPDDKTADAIQEILESHGAEAKRFIIETTAENVSEAAVEEPVADEGTGSALVIDRGLRSGQDICHKGTVIVLGDVNPGAEVKASGSIFVLGCLRGIAHAGAGGDESAVIFSRCLKPTQLRIAGLITRSPDEGGNAERQAEIARISGGNIIIDRYDR